MAGFTIPNDGDGAVSDQSEVHNADWVILGQGQNGYGVASGCAVTAQGTPDLTVAVASGVAYVGAGPVVVAGGNVTITPDGTNPRFVLIEVDSSGTLTANSGTASTNPAKPVPTSTKTVLAEVYVTGGASSITSGYIIDKRMFIFRPIKPVTVVFDGAGAVISTGAKKAYASIPFPCLITKWRLLADVSGSIVVDIWKDTYANYPPTVADTITASDKPTISSATKAEGTSLTGWTKTIAAGDVLEFNVDSATTVTKVVLILSVQP